MDRSASPVLFCVQQLPLHKETLHVASAHPTSDAPQLDADILRLDVTSALCEIDRPPPEPPPRTPLVTSAAAFITATLRLSACQVRG